MNTEKIYQGNCIEVLKDFPAESIDCVVTSPPYWGLRDYGTAEWEGGDDNCEHKGKVERTAAPGSSIQAVNKGANFVSSGDCECGAIRKDSQLGLEETPEEFVDNLVKVFSEIKRVLKKEGSVWLNLGDSYHNKSLAGIPWRVAFALQSDGWYLRQDIIWHKPAPMPESVKDRCTKAHEYIFLLTKSPKYFYDIDAIREDCVTHDNRPSGVVRERELDYNSKRNLNPQAYMNKYGSVENESKHRDIKMTELETHLDSIDNNPKGRNKRSVWSMNTSTVKDAHFATFPIELPTYCIKAGCPEGGIVLDPFFGSGTTGLAAQELHRHWVGIELNPEYIKIADRRVSQINLFV